MPITPPSLPQKIKEPQISDVSAKSFLVYDSETGSTLLAQDEHAKVPIASMTKLMTALVAYKYLDLTAPITVKREEVFSVRPVLGLRAGDTVKPQDLLQAMLVGSANDAAQALATATADQEGQTFTFLMNKEARQLGMNESYFSNPLGFDFAGNMSSAHDLSILIQAVQHLSVLPLTEHKTAYSFVSGTGSKYSVRATNKLLAKHSDVAAIKTGFTENAGGSMAVQIENNGHPFVIIVLQSSAREADVLKLKEIVENSFQF